MTSEELKIRLRRLNINTSILARAVGVVPITALQWCSNRTDVPGYVVAYLRVLNLLDSETKEAELNKFRRKIPGRPPKAPK